MFMFTGFAMPRHQRHLSFHLCSFAFLSVLPAGQEEMITMMKSCLVKANSNDEDGDEGVKDLIGTTVQWGTHENYPKMNIPHHVLAQHVAFLVLELFPASHRF